jgi:hypothetical protein
VHQDPTSKRSSTERNRVIIEWRRLGLISSVIGILVSIVGALFLIANVAIKRMSSNLINC